MPPKVKVTRENIIDTAVELVRAGGIQTVNARDVAGVLQCSTQPIFSNFATMDELRQAVIEKAEDLFCVFMQQEAAKGIYPSYKASGMAYIRFAKEEKELFKLLYMRERNDDRSPREKDIWNQMETMVQNQTGLAGGKKTLFHLEMWTFVHGIATMFATGYLDLEWELVSEMITDAYQGLKKRYEME